MKPTQLQTHTTIILAATLLASCLNLPAIEGDSLTSTTSDPDDYGLTWPPDLELPQTSFGGTTSASTTGTSSSTTTATSATSATGETTSADDTSGADDRPLPDLSGLRLTELLADPPGKDGAADAPEYIEMVNVSDDQLDLTHLVLYARSWPRLSAGEIGLTGVHLPPGGVLLLRRHTKADGPASPTVEVDGALITVTFATGEGLRNADGAVMLQGPGEHPLDAVIYGAPSPAPYDDPALWQGSPATIPMSGKALCRSALGPDTDTAADWVPCDPSPGSPPMPSDPDGEAGDPTTDEPQGEVLISIVEVFSNPPGPGNSEKFLEYVEILNYGADPVDLAGWTIADALAEDPPGEDPLLYWSGDGGCAPETCLAPGRRALIVGNTYQGPTGGALVLATDDTTIANAGLSTSEPVVLHDSNDIMMSTYRAWTDPLAAPHPLSIEEPLHRAAPDAEDHPESWSFGAPTPGSE
ncbi:MAG: lamin tail domain-containing protein [Nannocystis sp.]|nr:lamin tail domain-containing protein [Nannocystis sp.]